MHVHVGRKLDLIGVAFHGDDRIGSVHLLVELVAGTSCGKALWRDIDLIAYYKV